MSNYEYNKKYAKEWNENNTKTITIRLSNSQYEKLQKLYILSDILSFIRRITLYSSSILLLLIRLTIRI